MNFRYIKSILIGFIVVVLSSLLLTACLKDNFNFKKLAQTEWDPNVAIPLIYSSLTMNDILVKSKSDSVVQVDANNFITLVYKGQYLSLKASDVFIIPDQPFSESYNLDAGGVTALTSVPPGQTYSTSYTDTLNFDPNSPATPAQSRIVIDSISFKSGNWAVSFASLINDNVQIRMSIPKAKQNGVSFAQTFSINSMGTTNGSYNLSGYTFDLSAGGGNKIAVNYTVTITNSGNPVSPSQININQTFSTLAFKKIFGYLGQQTLSAGNDTIQFNIFQSSTSGSFTLANPSMHVTIQNSYGIPISATLSTFKVSGNSGSMGVTGAPNPLPIASPTVSQMGQYLTTSFSLSPNSMNLVNNAPTSSNIKAAVNSQPKYLVYDIAATSNPLGPPALNFVLDTSTIKVNMEVDLPLEGTASGFSFQDTLNFTFPSLNNVQSLLLRSNITNGFPIDLGIQIYFTDANLNKIDSLVTGNRIIAPSAIVNSGSGMVTSPTNKITDLTFNQARINKLTNVSKLLVVASASTYNGGMTSVKFYSTYHLDVKLGAQAQLKVKQ